MRTHYLRLDRDHLPTKRAASTIQFNKAGLPIKPGEEVVYTLHFQRGVHLVDELALAHALITSTTTSILSLLPGSRSSLLIVTEFIRAKLGMEAPPVPEKESKQCIVESAP